MSKSREQKLASLLQQALTGDRISLRELCHELKNDIHSYFQYKYREPELVDDLAQETFVRLLKSLPAVQEPLKLRSFVARVAVHVSHDYLRQKYRRREEAFSEQVEVATDGHHILGREAISTSSESVLSRVDLERALAGLPEKTRAILLLKSEGYKYEEIAEELSLSVSGVKMQIKRSLEKLRASLSDVTLLAVAATFLLEAVWR